MARYTVQPARPRGTAFWNLALVVVLVAALDAVSRAIAVAVVTLVLVGAVIVAVARAIPTRRPGGAAPGAGGR